MFVLPQKNFYLYNTGKSTRRAPRLQTRRKRKTPMKKYFYILLSLAVLATACDSSDKPTEEDNHQPIVVPHYVLFYIEEPVFQASYSTTLKYISLQHVEGKLKSYLDDNSAEYEALCVKRGDVNYDTPRNLPYAPGIRGAFMHYMYLADDITAIDLTADREWNGIAPGESWNAFCRIETTSARRHIESGYTYNYDWSTMPEEFSDRGSIFYKAVQPELEPITKLLSDCTEEDLSFIWLPDSGKYGSKDILRLHLTEAPESISEYGLTLRIATASGAVYDVPVV